MSDFAASILILLTVSPAMVVLVVLIARAVRNFGGTLFANGSWHEALARKGPCQGKLCGETS